MSEGFHVEKITMGHSTDHLRDFRPYQLLGYAIVEQAARDYEKVLVKALKQAQKKGHIEPMTLSKIADLERFFLGEWCERLAEGVAAGDKIIKAVRERVFGEVTEL